MFALLFLLLLVNGTVSQVNNIHQSKNLLVDDDSTIANISKSLFHSFSCEKSIVFTNKKEALSLSVEKFLAVVNFKTAKRVFNFQNRYKLHNLFNGVKCLAVWHDSETTDKLLKIVSNYSWLFTRRYWVVFAKSVNIADKIPLSDHFYIVNKQNSKFYLSETYSARKDPEENRIVTLTEWDNAKNEFALKKTFPVILHSSGNIIVRFAALKMSTICNVTSESGIERFVGFYGEFTDTLFKMFNGSYKVVLTQDNQFGTKNSSGQWSGMFGLVQRKSADIVAIAKPTTIRFEVTDFGPVMYYNHFRLLFRVITHKTLQYEFFLNPFHFKVWYALLAVTIYIQIFLASTKPKLNTCRKVSTSCYNPVVTLEAIWPAVIQEAKENVNKSSSTRIIFLTYLIFSFLTFAGYCSTLTAFLSVSITQDPFSTIVELVDNGYIPVIIKGVNFEEEFAEANEGHPLKRAWNVMVKNEKIAFAQNNEHGVEIVYKHQAGFLTSIRDAYPFIKGNCSFKFASELTSFFHSNIGYSKDFPYKKQFNIAMLKMHEVSFLKKINEKYNIPTWEPCAQELGFKPVNLYQVIGPLVVMSFGCVSAMITLTIEILASKSP